MTSPELPFDRVLIAETDGKRALTVDDFMQMPLEERIQHMLSGRLRFYAGELEVDRRLALQALRIRTAARE